MSDLNKIINEQRERIAELEQKLSDSVNAHNQIFDALRVSENRAEAAERERDELNHRLGLTVLTTHEATLDSEYGRKWKAKFAIEQQIAGMQRVLDCREYTLHQSDIGTIRLMQERLRQQLNGGE